MARISVTDVMPRSRREIKTKQISLPEAYISVYRPLIEIVEFVEEAKIQEVYSYSRTRRKLSM